MIRRRRKSQHRKHTNDTNIRIRKPKFLRRGLISHNRDPNTTPWKQPLACGGVSDLVVAVNFPKDRVISRFLPSYAHEQTKLKFGSTYRVSPHVPGYKCAKNSMDVLGMVLWYLNTSATLYMLAPLFRLASSLA